MVEINWSRWLVCFIVGVISLTWLLFTRNNALRLLAVLGMRWLWDRTPFQCSQYLSRHRGQGGYRWPDRVPGTGWIGAHAQLEGAACDPGSGDAPDHDLPLPALGGFLLGGAVEPIYANGYKLNQLFWLLTGLSLASSQCAFAAAREACLYNESEAALIHQRALGEHRPDHA